MKGVSLRHDPTRRQPFGVFVKVTIGTDQIRSAKFYDTDAAARVGLAHAEAEVQRLRDAHATKGATPTPAPETLAAYAAAWLELKTTLKPATAYSYEIAFRLHINPVIGALPIAAVDVDAIDRLRVALSKAGMSSNTMRRTLRTLSSCLGHARRRGKIATNPADRACAEVGTPDDELIEPNPLPPDVVPVFLAWVSQHAAGWALWFLFLIRTGARIGEASALRWDLVDFDRQVATVKRSFSPVAKRRSHTGNGDGLTKTGRGREIDLAPELVDALRDEQARQRKAALAAGLPPSPFVFVTPGTGVRVLTNNPTIAGVFAKAMKGIKRTAAAHTLHDLRDTFATMHLLADPKRLLWVSATLGHRQITTTLTRYSKYVRTIESAGYAAAFDSATSRAKAALDDARK